MVVRSAFGREDIILPTPNSCGWEVHDAFKRCYKPSEPIAKIKAAQKKSIFPRSPVFEYYHKSKAEDQAINMFNTPCGQTKNQNVTDLNKNVISNTLNLSCQPNFRSETLNPYSYPPIQPWEPQPQFWYKPEAAFKGPTWPVGNPNDYRFQPLPSPPPTPGQLKEALEVEREERYLPGEIYKNKIPKEPIQEFQGTDQCKTEWEPKISEVFYGKFDEKSLPKHPLLSNAIKKEEIELRKKLISKENDQNCNRNANKLQTQCLMDKEMNSTRLKQSCVKF